MGRLGGNKTVVKFTRTEGGVGKASAVAIQKAEGATISQYPNILKVGGGGGGTKRFTLSRVVGGCWGHKTAQTNDGSNFAESCSCI